MAKKNREEANHMADQQIGDGFQQNLQDAGISMPAGPDQASETKRTVRPMSAALRACHQVEGILNKLSFEDACMVHVWIQGRHSQRMRAEYNKARQAIPGEMNNQGMAGAFANPFEDA